MAGEPHDKTKKKWPRVISSLNTVNLSSYDNGFCSDIDSKWNPETSFMPLFFIFISLPITFTLHPAMLIQHQPPLSPSPMAPAGWPPASHFLSRSPAIQRWRAPSGLSGPRGVHQKLGSHRRFLLVLREPSEWGAIVLAVIWWPHSTEDKAKGLPPHPPTPPHRLC